MSGTNIKASEYPIQKIFSDDFAFIIPVYQRPYAWGEVQASELLDDLLTFMGEGAGEVADLNPYFLGSIVLIQGNNPKAEVVDAQQRLTTLTILLSALRTLVPHNYAKALTKYLYEEGDVIAGTPNSYRVKLRELDAQFFRENIQEEDGIQKLHGMTAAKLPDSQANVRDNALLFVKQLQSLSDSRRLRLAQFVAQRCFLVVVSTPDFDSAYRIFSVLNGRGMQLLYTDILKADVIGKLAVSERDAYTKKWESEEERLGRDAFQSLFAYIRMIYRKVKPQGTIIDEFRKTIKPAENPQHFIDAVLLPYANAFYQIKNEDYQSAQNADKVNALFKWLNKIDNVDWWPPAILFLAKNSHDANKLITFFVGLERLAAGMMILRKNVNERIQRYGRILNSIENGDDFSLPDSHLQLEVVERQEILTRVDGNLYKEPTAKYILLRLDDALSSGATLSNVATVSIEHVLPQQPKLGSHWLTWFSDQQERETWTNRLGNLVLLAKNKNSQAQNFDFDEKKSIYFNKPVATSALTVQVLQQSQWTPPVLMQRQTTLLTELKRIWDL